MNEVDWVALLFVALTGGLVVGTIWGRAQTNWYWRSKAGDATGFRTGVHSGGKMYYVVSEREYVDKVTRP